MFYIYIYSTSGIRGGFAGSNAKVKLSSHLRPLILSWRDGPCLEDPWFLQLTIPTNQPNQPPSHNHPPLTGVTPIPPSIGSIHGALRVRDLTSLSAPSTSSKGIRNFWIQEASGTPGPGTKALRGIWYMPPPRRFARYHLQKKKALWNGIMVFHHHPWKKTALGFPGMIRRGFGACPGCLREIKPGYEDY